MVLVVVQFALRWRLDARQFASSSLFHIRWLLGLEFGFPTAAPLHVDVAHAEDQRTTVLVTAFLVEVRADQANDGRFPVL